jgi:predicted RNA-binding protein
VTRFEYRIWIADPSGLAVILDRLLSLFYTALTFRIFSNAMKYLTYLFSPDTYKKFYESDRSVVGVRHRARNVASTVKPGDRLVCYLTRLSRWIGILEVVGESYEDSSPLFTDQDDPFVIRMKVRPIVFLDLLKSVPIHDNTVWNALSFTKSLSRESSVWTGKLRASLNSLSKEDGSYLEQLLISQSAKGITFPLDGEDQKKLQTHQVHRPDKVVAVSVPEEEQHEVLDLTEVESESRESIRMQALLARIGATMSHKIWIPRSDRAAVLKEWAGVAEIILDQLPLNYDITTLKTIEQIDVIWMRKTSIVRAFEVEHTTSIYSGILRMADLLALQPNMDIKLHIVAPAERRDKVFREIRRPVFSLLEKGPLAESCTFLSYDSVRELAKSKHLAHLSDTVLEDYAEEAE